jgi:hypothetical protein
MDLSEFGSTGWLRVSDLEEAGGTLQVSIVGVEINHKIKKPILHLSDGSQLATSPTNCSTIFRHWGTESTDLIGKEIELFIDVIVIDGEEKQMIKIRCISPPLELKDKKVATPKKKKVAKDMDDEIPY